MKNVLTSRPGYLTRRNLKGQSMLAEGFNQSVSNPRFHSLYGHVGISITSIQSSHGDSYTYLKAEVKSHY